MERIFKKPLTPPQEEKSGTNRSAREQQWEAVFASLEQVHAHFVDLDKELSQKQSQLLEATRSLDSGRGNYLDLYRSWSNLLRGIANDVIICEQKGYHSMAQNLEELLLMEKVERFELGIGDPVVAGKCVVIGTLETDAYLPGSVVMVSSPGFYHTVDDMVVLAAEVFKAVPLPKVKKDRILISELAHAQGLDSPELATFLLLEACAQVSK